MVKRTTMMLLVLLAFLGAAVTHGGGQTSGKNNAKIIGGPFENREFTYSGITRFPAAIDTSPGWKENGQKLLLTGTVTEPDGRTPAHGVLIYYYQTNTEGRYLHVPEEPRSMAPNERGQTHGHIRGWVRSDSNGRYSIYTIRPGSYPGRNIPAHVHVTIKEPNSINEYYIDDFEFDDDPLLTRAERNKLEKRGGSGVMKLVRKGELIIGERTIILGMNIPDHPHEAGTGNR